MKFKSIRRGLPYCPPLSDVQQPRFHLYLRHPAQVLTDPFGPLPRCSGEVGSCDDQGTFAGTQL